MFSLCKICGFGILKSATWNFEITCHFLSLVEWAKTICENSLQYIVDHIEDVLDMIITEKIAKNLKFWNSKLNKIYG